MQIAAALHTKIIIVFAPVTSHISSPFLFGGQTHRIVSSQLITCPSAETTDKQGCGSTPKDSTQQASSGGQR
jgi:hypothetical protein